MGCWDVTCGISHLPIQAGDPIRLSILRQPLYYDGIQKSWATWLPVSVPLKGVYDNYGGIEGYENDRITQFQVECLKRFAVWGADPDGRYDKEPDDPEFPNTMESLLNACERGGLCFRMPYEDHAEDKETTFKTVRTASFMIHEEIYQHMISGTDRNPPGVGTRRHRLEKNGDGGLLLGRGVDGLRSATEWTKGAEDRKELHQKLAEHDKEGSKDVSFLIEKSYGLSLRDLGSHSEATPDLTCIGCEWKPKIENWPSLLEFTEEDWKELSNRVLEQEVLFWTMRECRRMIHPALHTDQWYYPDNNLDANRMLHHFIDKMTVAIQEKAKRKQEEHE